MDLKQVTPVNHVETQGQYYKYEYTFDGVDVEQAAEELSAQNAEIGSRTLEDIGDVVTYQYKSRPKVFISEDTCYVTEGVSAREGENQAYFALSIMDREGLVSRLRKK